MQRSTTAFLLISLMVLLASACGSDPVKGLSSISGPKIYEPPYFADVNTDYVYKANITIYGHELSGIAIIKKTADTIHRVVLTTDFGNKLLDLEISDHAYKINDIVDDLNRKMLINTLVTDFRILLRNKFEIFEAYPAGEQRVLVSREHRNYSYIYIENQRNTLRKIDYGTKRKPRFSILFHRENDIFADTIAISHHNIRLRILMNHLQNP